MYMCMCIVYKYVYVLVYAFVQYMHLYSICTCTVYSPLQDASQEALSLAEERNDSREKVDDTCSSVRHYSV